MPHHSNANLATSSFDRATGAITQQSVDPYNAFSVQTIGGPIIQGQISKIRVSEIYFPYDIPTVVEGRNDKMIVSVVKLVNTAPGAYTITSTPVGVTVPAGWYTPAELVAAVTVAVNAALTAAAFPLNLAFTYDGVGQTVTAANTAVWDATALATNYLYQLLPGSLTTNASQVWSTPQLLTTLSLRNIFLNYPAIAPLVAGVAFTTPTLVPATFPNGAAGLPTFPSGYHPVSMRSAPISGRYTDWIDIVSHRLCEAQYIRDSTTNQVAVRKDLIARLYIEDETSMPFMFDGSGNPIAVGSRPFVIHRQFKNAKIIKSTLENSASSLDLSLYDMYGLPVPLPPTAADNGEVLVSAGYRDYGITFHAEEADRSTGNVGYY